MTRGLCTRILRRLATAVAAAMVLLCVPSTSSTAFAAAPFDTAPATASLKRLLPAQAAQFILVPVDKPASGDYFRISGVPGQVTVEGTSPGVLLTGVNWYLKYVAGVDLGWPGDSTSRLPDQLPAPASAIQQSAVVANRYALNDTDDGYAGAYLDWPAWEHKIDMLASHGINEVLVTPGTDEAYRETFADFGYTDSEIRSWIPAPAHQPWWLLQNMCCFGGPVSDSLLKARVALTQKIVARVRDLGMTPVLPGYFGTVPDRFAEKNPGASVVPQGPWGGFTRPDWLDPTNPLFPKVAASFYRHQHDLYGDSAMYKMDLLHEGGDPGSVSVPEAAKAVMTALQTAHPGATWTLLGWQDNPSTAIIDAVDKSKLFIVDGQSERNGDDRESKWHSAPYAFGTINNFGGRATLGAATGVWTTRFPQWRTKPGSALSGIAYMPEASGGDPGAFELFTELAWHTDTIDPAAWYAVYANRRYGGADPHAAAAWNALAQTAYALTEDPDWTDPQDSLFTARPGLDVKTANTLSFPGMRYDAARFATAADELLQVAPALRDSDAYRFDLVNVTRQALANHSRVLLPQINDAYQAKDITRFDALTGQWSHDEALLDQLIGTDPRFLLGTWVAGARAIGATDDEKAQLEYDARSIITTWSDTEASQLHDYANHELSGMINDFYAMRWNRYFASLHDALANNTTPKSIDWFAMENDWAHQRTAYPTTPSGDSYTIASAATAELRAIIGIGGKCVDVTGGSSADGTPIQLATCNGTPAQQWRMAGDGTVQALGKCLDVTGGATTNSTPIQLFQCNSTPAQAWQPNSAGELVNQKSGRCLDATGGSSADGTRLIIWDCHSGPNQQWSLPDKSAGLIIGIGGKCVDVKDGSSADGTPIQLATCNGTPAQQWRMAGDGTVQALGKCLDVTGGATTPGTVVQLFQCNGTQAQSWTYQSDTTLKNTKSGLCLDAYGGSSADGTPLIIWTCTANANQRWVLRS